MTSKSPRARALWPRGDNFTEFISPPRRCAENNKICVGIRPVFYKSVKCNFNWGARTFSEHKNILNLSNAENFDYFRSDLATFLALSFTTSTSHWILFHANFFFRKAFSLYSTSTSFFSTRRTKKGFRRKHLFTLWRPEQIWLGQLGNSLELLFLFFGNPKLHYMLPKPVNSICMHVHLICTIKFNAYTRRVSKQNKKDAYIFFH